MRRITWSADGAHAALAQSAPARDRADTAAGHHCLGTLDIAITIDDPGAFTQPFTVAVRQLLSPSDDLMEFICNENEQSSKHYVRQ